MRFLLLFLFVPLFALSQTKYQKDFEKFWTDFNDNYAYFDKQKIDWPKVKTIYQPEVDTITNNTDFLRLLERIVNELHNGHVSLNTNLPSSNRIIPSGSDLFIENKNNAYFITDVRANSAASLCGLLPDMEVVQFNGKPIKDQLSFFLPRYTLSYANDMYSYALNMLFAGSRDKARTITVIQNGQQKIFYPDNFKKPTVTTLLEYKILSNNTGYIKINNSLGDYGLIKEFDLALDSLLTTRALILDLTETPGGGNTTVARAMLGRFINKEMPYQKHVIVEKQYGVTRSWVEYVSPRGKLYKNRLIVMAGHWTGSMGEGISIAFDAVKRGSLVGTKMAGLLGAIDGFKASETGIGYQFPTEKLFHIDGTPREDFVPPYLTKNMNETWKKAMQLADVK